MGVPMRSAEAKPLAPYPRDMDITKSQGGASREAEYYEHYRSQGVALRQKYRRP